MHTSEVISRGPIQSFTRGRLTCAVGRWNTGSVSDAAPETVAGEIAGAEVAGAGFCGGGVADDDDEAGGWAPQPIHHTHDRSASNRFTSPSLTPAGSDRNRENQPLGRPSTGS